MPPEKLPDLNDVRAPKISNYERKMITALLEILLPFEEATDFAQTRHIPSPGYVIPALEA